MTITARQTSTRIRAATTLVNKLSALPLAVGEIHRAIDDGNIRDNDRGHREDAGIRSKNTHTDPTADTAIARTAAHERYLADIEDNLATLALAAGNLCHIVNRWVVSAANREEHPRCNGGAGVEAWTRPDCTDYVTYDLRTDGSYSYRQDGLCNACRVRRHRSIKESQVVA